MVPSIQQRVSPQSTAKSKPHQTIKKTKPTQQHADDEWETF
jgi:hypothetical protein